MIKIDRNLVQEIFEQGKRELPNEACGYLAGKEGLVQKRIEMTNVDQSPEHFSFDPKEQFAAVKEARAEGLTLISVYHTHPVTPARPSEEDIRLAYDPDISYIIASLSEDSIKSFKIKGGEVTPEELQILDL